MQIMKLVEYKHLLVSFKTKLKKLEKESNKKVKELEDEIKKLQLQLAIQIIQQNKNAQNILSKNSAIIIKMIGMQKKQDTY